MNELLSWFNIIGGFRKFIAYRRVPGALCMTAVTMKVERRDLL